MKTIKPKCLHLLKNFTAVNVSVNQSVVSCPNVLLNIRREGGRMDGQTLNAEIPFMDAEEKMH
jgi:hypothetical protein